jgi:hypothetical protein
MRMMPSPSQHGPGQGGQWFRCGLTILLAVMALSAPSSSDAFELRGFGDVTFTKSDAPGSDVPGSTDHHGSFTLGQVDLYITQPITDHIDLLAELAIESDTASSETTIDVERLQISYRAKNWLVVRAGRFHNILGYWNITFHHGREIQTTIERPRMLAFEDDGGFLPVHLIGLWVGGYVPVGPLLFDYGFMVGNGPKITGVTSPVVLNNGSLDPNNISDNSGNKAVSFELTLHPMALHNTGLGICGNFSRIEGFDTGGQQVANVNQQILCSEAHYVTESVELLAEFYTLFDQDEQTGLGHFTNYTWYTQAAYTFAGRYMPYVRYEHTSVDEGDPYMSMLDIVDTFRTILGFRYNLSSASSLKAEARFVSNPAPSGAAGNNLAGNGHEFAVQWAFWF